MSCEAIVMSQYCSRNAYTITTRIAAIAYDFKSVTFFLAFFVEPDCLRFSKTSHDVRVLSNPVECLRCVGALVGL